MDENTKKKLIKKKLHENGINGFEMNYAHNYYKI